MRIRCDTCGKKIKEGTCEICEGKLFHEAHIGLLKGYLNYEDPIKEIKRIVKGS